RILDGLLSREDGWIGDLLSMGEDQRPRRSGERSAGQRGQRQEGQRRAREKNGTERLHRFSLSWRRTRQPQTRRGPFGPNLAASPMGRRRQNGGGIAARPWVVLLNAGG